MASHEQSLLPSSKIRKLLTYGSGPFAGIAAFIFANEGIMIKSETVIALLWALIAYILAQHVVQIVDDEDHNKRLESRLVAVEKKIDDTSASFRKDLGQIFKVSLVTSDQFDSKVSQAIAEAVHVKNTYVGIRDITGVKTLRGEKVKEYYRTVLSKEDSSWEDIIGVGEFLDGRVQRIYSTLGENMKGEYSQLVLGTHSPIFNILLMGPRGPQMSDVFFGWVKNTSTELDMFHSRDRQVIAMFERYFSALKSNPNKITRLEHAKDGTTTGILSSPYYRFRGKWFSVSGAPDIKSSNVISYAVVEFSYTDDWKIHGKVYNKKTGKPEYSILSDMCLLIGNTLYYKYHNTDEFGHVSSFGVGAYTLSGEEEVLKGYYVIKNSRSCTLSAVKIDDAESEIPSPRVDQYIQRLLRQGNESSDPALAEHSDQQSPDPHS